MVCETIETHPRSTVGRSFALARATFSWSSGALVVIIISRIFTIISKIIITKIIITTIIITLTIIKK